MSKAAAAEQQNLSFSGRDRMDNTMPPGPPIPSVREAFDKVDRLQSCLDGFAILMAPDPDAMTGTKARGDVETLINFLLEQHQVALGKLRDVTFRALSTSL